MNGTHSSANGRTEVEKIRRPVLITAITASRSAILIKGQLEYLRIEGYRPILISSPGPEVEQLSRDEGVELIPVYMEREIGFIQDLRSLFQLVRVFRRIRPAIVNAGTPKAGLLCTLAAWMCRVPVRIYTLRGFRHESASPRLKQLLIRIERLVCRFTHKVICISPSIRETGLAKHIIPENKAVVIGAGSSNGIDLNRFSPDRWSAKDRKALREQNNIEENDLVIGFVGRLVSSKGVSELIEAWPKIRTEYLNAKLLMVGPFEETEKLPEDTISALKNDPSIVTTGFVPDVERYFAIMDIFTLPTYREGFGNVLIQAAAMALPIVTTDVTGVRDAVKADYNAIVVPARDVHALTEALRTYINDPQLRRRHGESGRVRVQEKFDEKLIWQGLTDLYQQMLRGSICNA